MNVAHLNPVNRFWTYMNMSADALDRHDEASALACHKHAKALRELYPSVQKAWDEHKIRVKAHC